LKAINGARYPMGVLRGTGLSLQYPSMIEIQLSHHARSEVARCITNMAVKGHITHGIGITLPPSDEVSKQHECIDGIRYSTNDVRKDNRIYDNFVEHSMGHGVDGRVEKEEWSLLLERTSTTLEMLALLGYHWQRYPGYPELASLPGYYLYPAVLTFVLGYLLIPYVRIP